MYVYYLLVLFYDFWKKKNKIKDYSIEQTFVFLSFDNYMCCLSCCSEWSWIKNCSWKSNTRRSVFEELDHNLCM